MIKLTQDMPELWFEFCNYAGRFSVYCLANDLSVHKKEAVKNIFIEEKIFS